jgi:hypothetical protein
MTTSFDCLEMSSELSFRIHSKHLIEFIENEFANEDFNEILADACNICSAADAAPFSDPRFAKIAGYESCAIMAIQNWKANKGI